MIHNPNPIYCTTILLYNYSKNCKLGDMLLSLCLSVPKHLLQGTSSYLHFFYSPPSTSLNISFFKAIHICIFLIFYICDRKQYNYVIIYILLYVLYSNIIQVDFMPWQISNGLQVFPALHPLTLPVFEEGFQPCLAWPMLAPSSLQVLPVACTCSVNPDLP